MYDDDGIQRPSYVLTCNGSSAFLSFVDDWCYGPSRYIGKASDGDAARRMAREDLRKLDSPGMPVSSLPFYFVSDHGNVHRRRAIYFRRGGK